MNSDIPAPRSLREIELEVLAEDREWMRQRLEQKLQAEANRHGGVFPPQRSQSVASAKPGATAGFVLAAITTVIRLHPWSLRPNPSAGFSCPVLAALCLTAALLRWRRLRKNQASLHPAVAAKSVTFIDEPLQDLTPETDAFGRASFVSALAGAILESDPQSCHVLGLVGPWGSGKTSVINAVAAKCQPAFRVVRIDSWAFRDTGRLTEAVLTSLVKEIQRHYLLPDLKRTLARYLSIISPAVKSVPIRQLLRTPRQVKRACIALSRRSILVSRLNPFDAFVWQVLRQHQQQSNHRTRVFFDCP